MNPRRAPLDLKCLVASALLVALALYACWSSQRPVAALAATHRRIAVTPPRIPGRALAAGKASALREDHLSLPLDAENDSSSFEQVMGFLDRAGTLSPPAGDFGKAFLKDPELRAAWEQFKVDASKEQLALDRTEAGQGQAVKSLVAAVAKSDKFRKLMQEFGSQPGFQLLVAQAAGVPAVSAVLAAGPVAPEPSFPHSPASARSGSTWAALPGARMSGAPWARNGVGPAGKQGSASSPASGYGNGRGQPGAGPGLPSKESGREGMAPGQDNRQRGQGARDARSLGGLSGDIAAAIASRRVSLWSKMSAADRDAVLAALEATGNIWTACALANHMAACAAALEACRQDPDCLAPPDGTLEAQPWPPLPGSPGMPVETQPCHSPGSPGMPCVEKFKPSPCPHPQSPEGRCRGGS